MKIFREEINTYNMYINENIDFISFSYIFLNDRFMCNFIQLTLYILSHHMYHSIFIKKIYRFFVPIVILFSIIFKQNFLLRAIDRLSRKVNI